MKKTLLALLGLATGVAIASEFLPIKPGEYPVNAPGIERRLSDMELFQLLNHISPMDSFNLYPTESTQHSMQEILEVESRGAKILDQHYPITGLFHEKRPNTPGGGGTRYHEGTDVATPSGTPIHNPWKGVVTFAGWMPGYGKTMDVMHKNGLTTRYAHLSKWLASEGDTVLAGQNIALTGNSGKKPNGKSYDPHSHVEVKRGGITQNPLDYNIIP